jgi:putative cell wall-binding protein
LAGADRYSSAAALSANTFSPGVDTLFVAVGTNYPDALAGAAASVVAAGPVLLVRTSAVPSATASELNRLNPDQILVLGGTAVVSVGVASQLAAYEN